ncbi:DUF5753 domain-containing protein [Saccharopolyspora hordei]
MQQSCGFLLFADDGVDLGADVVDERRGEADAGVVPPEPPRTQVVMSESCLRREWALEDVMREQIEHLIELSNRPNMMLQIMPFKAAPGRRSPIGTRFGLLRVPSPGAAGPIEVAYTEGVGDPRYLDDQRALDAHESAWARLTNAALRFDESRAFLKALSSEYAT